MIAPHVTESNLTSLAWPHSRDLLCFSVVGHAVLELGVEELKHSAAKHKRDKSPVVQSASGTLLARFPVCSFSLLIFGILGLPYID